MAKSGIFQGRFLKLTLILFHSNFMEKKEDELELTYVGIYFVNKIFYVYSIENEPLKNDTKLQISTRTSPKIAELKQTIESQLARRNETPSTALVGGIDVLAPAPLLRASSIAGSNTSLGSSILDDSESLPPVLNNKAFVKPKKITHKDDSEIDLSEFSTDGIVTNKIDRDAF